LEAKTAKILLDEKTGRRREIETEEDIDKIWKEKPERGLAIRTGYDYHKGWGVISLIIDREKIKGDPLPAFMLPDTITIFAPKNLTILLYYVSAPVPSGTLKEGIKICGQGLFNPLPPSDVGLEHPFYFAPNMNWIQSEEDNERPFWMDIKEAPNWIYHWNRFAYPINMTYDWDRMIWKNGERYLALIVNGWIFRAKHGMNINEGLKETTNHLLVYNQVACHPKLPDPIVMDIANWITKTPYKTYEEE
jgi:hypothetical protein